MFKKIKMLWQFSSIIDRVVEYPNGTIRIVLKKNTSIESSDYDS